MYPEAVIFDLDGLLIDTEPLWGQVEIAVFKQVGLSLTRADLKPTKGLRINEVIDYFYGQQPWSSPTKNAVAENIVNRMEIAIRKSSKAMPGAIDAVMHAKAAGLKIAIASSSPLRLIEAAAERLKINGIFDQLVSAWELPHGKPHPGVFLLTAHRLETPPQKCLVLEDSFHGMVAALAAKMNVWAIAEHPDDPRFGAATRVHGSLTEIPAGSFRNSGA